MRLLVLGASGQCGAHFVRLAAGRKHEVTAVVRPSTSYEPPAGVRLLRGEVLDEAFVRSIVSGCDVVVSCLGPKRRNPKNPWSRLSSPPGFAERSAKILVEALRAAGVQGGQKIIAISAAGVAESYPRMNWVMKFFVKTSTVGLAYEDLARMEAVYASSGLEWQAVRPTVLTNGPATGRVQVIDSFPVTARISREDVAWYMLERIERGEWEPRTPIITSR